MPRSYLLVSSACDFPQSYATVVVIYILYITVVHFPKSLLDSSRHLSKVRDQQSKTVSCKMFDGFQKLHHGQLYKVGEM